VISLRKATIAGTIALSLGTVHAYAKETPAKEAPAKSEQVSAEPLSTSELDAVNKLLEKIKPAELDTESARAVVQAQGIDLTPEMIMAIRKALLMQDEALIKPVTEINLKVDSERLNVSVIQAPITLSIRNGYDTFIEFYDITGAPWPATKNINIGAKELFEAVALDSEDEQKSHIIRISAKSRFGESTLTVHLKGLKETVNFRLLQNELKEEVDYKRIFTLPMVNPEAAAEAMARTDSAAVSAKTASMNEFAKAASVSLEPFFTGSVPDGAIAIPVLEGDAMAWMYKNDLYIRSTNEIIQYPAAHKGSQKFGEMYVHIVAPFPRITYYKDSRPVTIHLDDDALVSAIEYQKQQAQQSLDTQLNLKMIGG
jgi:hypothetical protein